MQWWGPSNDLEFIDKPDTLTIRAVSVRRRGDLLLPSAFALGLIVAPWFGAELLILAALGIASAALFYSWFKTSIIELRVTQQGLQTCSAKGSLSVSWSEIKGLEYRAGGEYDPSGLYARQSRWQSICITNQLTKPDCERVITAIFTRFPLLKPAVDNDGGILNFGLRDESSLWVFRKKRSS
jgi:hypothetical protein